MIITKPFDFEPLSPEDVLAIIRDDARHAGWLDPEADEYIVLSFDSSVADWLDASGMVNYYELRKKPWLTERVSEWVNEWFGVSFSDEEWSEVLQPETKKDLRGVCRLIASRATRLSVKPHSIASPSCMSLGAFLSIRQVLLDAGVPVGAVRPSSPLEPYTKEHWRSFMREIGKLAPGALPTAGFKPDLDWFHIVTFFLLAAGASLCLAHALTGSVFCKSSSLLCFVAGLLIMVIAGLAAKISDQSVHFGELRTFRDLSLAVSENVKARELDITEGPETGSPESGVTG